MMQEVDLDISNNAACFSVISDYSSKLNLGYKYVNLPSLFLFTFTNDTNFEWTLYQRICICVAEKDLFQFNSDKSELKYY